MNFNYFYELININTGKKVREGRISKTISHDNRRFILLPNPTTTIAQGELLAWCLLLLLFISQGWQAPLHIIHLAPTSGIHRRTERVCCHRKCPCRSLPFGHLCVPHFDHNGSVTRASFPYVRFSSPLVGDRRTKNAQTPHALLTSI